MESSEPAGRRGNPGLYGGMPGRQGPPGMAARLLELADELRAEGVAVGTSELLDAFDALDAVSWTSQEDFREALAATLAKSQEDRHVLDVLFDRFFFRAVEREAVERGLTEERFTGGEGIDLEDLRERIRDAIRAGRGRRDARPRPARDRGLRPPGRGLRRDRGGRPAHPAQPRAARRAPAVGGHRAAGPRRRAAREPPAVRAARAPRARARC